MSFLLPPSPRTVLPLVLLCPKTQTCQPARHITINALPHRNYSDRMNIEYEVLDLLSKYKLQIRPEAHGYVIGLLPTSMDFSTSRSHRFANGWANLDRLSR
ncbi:hypothetical protein EV421DRAFT_1807294 [Armillaria borealis]|uniref:Uncharacterized protein n=1 Tax=Armillaria borealis TaxID=47425 RepID=A0AA39MR54_9AGAR|nr:hypothetical protein EV421DRAFT_1807294 [Armillaria borealis]